MLCDRLAIIMVSARVLQLWMLACLALPAEGENYNHLVIAPQSPLLEMGANFTATCMIINTTDVTTDDLYWKLSDTLVPREQYTLINRSALSVTVLPTSDESEWLFCRCKKKSPYVILNAGRFIHGIFLTKGYRPGKPQNLSCEAVQKGKFISPEISCKWEPVGRQTKDVPTTYTLNVVVTPTQTYNVSTQENHAIVSMDVYPHYMTLDIWVEAHNKLGKVESEHLKEEANRFVKTKPPSDVHVIPENAFPTSLLITWTPPIRKSHLSLTYEIRYCRKGQNWTYVPPVDTAKDIESFRLQNLKPYTVYVIQVRCKNEREDQGYWSDWSTNITERTPGDRPTSTPDLWKISAEVDGMNKRQVCFLSKDPVSANGRIIRFDIKIEDGEDKVKNGSWESVHVNRSEDDSSSSQREITFLKQIDLADKKSIEVSAIAVNSLGESPVALLIIPQKGDELPPVKDLKVWSHEGQLWLEWKSPRNAAVSEYVVEWTHGDQIDWQRETRTTRQTAIKGNLEKFVCYKVSVYPVHTGKTGKSATKEVYLEEGVPLEGPTFRLSGTPGRNEAQLVWEEIPQNKRQGFITHYTIYYTNGIEVHDVTVPGNATSYTLKLLSGDTKYDTWISASTIRGSTKSSNHTFTTAKYAPGEIEAIVVGVSLGFLFVVLMTMLTCIYKKDVIKENFWPQIPNPGESTIGNWSPDYPLKAETPKEHCLSGISVLDVDACDGKCMFEEDKASLPLKKDKYLSEEHSSGIGGSSCMSSPRQSVSDSDEGGDMDDTTANTIVYSSVVASNGYKGQTPSSQAQQAFFSRSESTQPLLDSEENPDMLVPEGSRQSQRFTHTAGMENGTGLADFNQLEREQQEALVPLDFYPLKEDSEQTTPTDAESADWLSATAVSSYMPQLGGYRPQ